MAAQYARTNKVPYLGICLGMQVRWLRMFSQALTSFSLLGCGAAQCALTSKMPCLGICLGLQARGPQPAISSDRLCCCYFCCWTVREHIIYVIETHCCRYILQVAVIEFCRNVLGMKGADSTEFNPATPHPAVVFMPEGSTTHKGGTMRLGARRTVLQVGTLNCDAVCYRAVCYRAVCHRECIPCRSTHDAAATLQPPPSTIQRLWYGFHVLLLLYPQTINCTAAKLYQKESFLDERHRHRQAEPRHK